MGFTDNLTFTVDALGNSSYFEYDAMNRLTKVRLFRIDSLRKVNEEQITLYSYDRRGLVTKEINAAGDETIYVYDGNGNLIQKTDADGYVTEYGCDPRNLVDAVNYSDGKEVLFAYNKNGELIAMTDWNGVTAFELDLLGRIVAVNDHNNNLVSYTYDAVGNQTSMTYPDGTAVYYTYDLLGRLTNVKDAEGQNTAYTYDAAGQLIAQASPNGWNVTYQYDPAGQLLRQYDEAPTKKAVDSIEHKYTYDPQGNILTEYRSASNGVSRYNLSHTYDALNHMLTTAGDQGYKNQTYTYDSLGNLIYEQIHNKGTEYWYNSLNQQIKKTEDGKDTYVYTYDKRGNLVTAVYTKFNTVTAQYTYDAANRMVKGVNAEGEESRYIYNGLGYLVSNEWIIDNNAYGYHGFPVSTDNGKMMTVRKDFTLDYTSALKNVILEQEDGSGGLTYRYVYGLRKLSVVVSPVETSAGELVTPDGEVKLFYHSDRLFTTEYLTDNVSGKITSFVEYDPWGNPLSKTVIRLGLRELDLVTQYTVHPYDQVLGVYFAQARMYDAQGLRFLAMDRYPPNMVNTQSWNRYVYVLNNVLVYVDLTGLAPVKVDGAAITVGATGLITNVYVDDIDGTIYINFYEALEEYGLTPETDSFRVGGRIEIIDNGKNNLGSIVYYASRDVLVVNADYQDRNMSGNLVKDIKDNIVYKQVYDNKIPFFYVGENDASNIYVSFEYFKELMCSVHRNKTTSYNKVLEEHIEKTKYSKKTSISGVKFIICEEAPSSINGYTYQQGYENDLSKVIGIKSHVIGDGNITIGIGTGIPINDTARLAQYGLTGDMTHAQAQQHSISINQAIELVMIDIELRERKLNDFLNKYKIELTQYQYDALMSFTYNIRNGGTNLWSGTTARSGDSMVEFIRDGKGIYDPAAVDKTFALYKDAPTRRQRESDMFNNKGYTYNNTAVLVWFKDRMIMGDRPK